jgi:hypothetical protein
MSRPTVKDLTGKPSLSHSSLTTFLDCGEKYRLTKIMKAPQDQAWWFIGGSAFHSSTEMFDLGDTRSIREVWDEAWAQQMENFDPNKRTFAGGKATKANPNKEDAAWWGLQGPVMVENYLRWRQSSGYQILDIDGKPAVEIEFNLILPNPDTSEDASPNLVVNGFIDRVMVSPNGEVVVVDLKTGSYDPASPAQLGIYAAGLRQMGYEAHVGAYYLARRATLGQARSLSLFTDEYVAYLMGTFEQSVRNQTFIPQVTSRCSTCMVASSCYAVGGTPPHGLPFQSTNVT